MDIASSYQWNKNSLKFKIKRFKTRIKDEIRIINYKWDKKYYEIKNNVSEKYLVPIAVLNIVFKIWNRGRLRSVNFSPYSETVYISYIPYKGNKKKKITAHQQVKIRVSAHALNKKNAEILVFV